MEDFGEYKYHIDQIKFHAHKKKYHIQKAIEELIIHQYPREEISVKVKKDLKGVVSEKYVEEICSEVGATRPYGQKKEEPEQQAQEQVVDNGDGTVSKVGAGDSGGAKPDASNPTKPKGTERPSNWHPYHEENQLFIEYVKRNIELQQEIIKKLETSPFLSKLDLTERKDFDEFLYCGQQVIDQTREAWDDRQKIPVITQLELFSICVDESNAHSAHVYISKVKELYDISAKQIGKTLRGVVRKVISRVEPNSERTALTSGFYGKPCTQCGNWRVKYEHGWLHCFKCEHDEEAEPEKLPKGGMPENAQELNAEFMDKVNRGELN